MIGKCEDVEAKNSSWAVMAELLTHIPKLFLQAVDPLCMKTADPKNTDPRLVETRRLILETPP